LNCQECNKEIRESANFCPFCGTQILAPGIQTDQNLLEGDANTFGLFEKINERLSPLAKGTLTVVLIAVFSSIFILLTSGNGGGSSSNKSSGDIVVDEFYCSIGTETASIVISSKLEETVNAFVTVGLYGSEGTLQHTATSYAFVEPGGTSLVNVPLDPYVYTVGDCKVVNSGY